MSIENVAETVKDFTFEKLEDSNMIRMGFTNEEDECDSILITHERLQQLRDEADKLLQAL